MENKDTTIVTTLRYRKPAKNTSEKEGTTLPDNFSKMTIVHNDGTLPKAKQTSDWRLPKITFNFCKAIKDYLWEIPMELKKILKLNETSNKYTATLCEPSNFSLLYLHKSFLPYVEELDFSNYKPSKPSNRGGLVFENTGNVLDVFFKCSSVKTLKFNELSKELFPNAKIGLPESVDTILAKSIKDFDGFNWEKTHLSHIACKEDFYANNFPIAATTYKVELTEVHSELLKVGEAPIRSIAIQKLKGKMDCTETKKLETISIKEIKENSVISFPQTAPSQLTIKLGDIGANTFLEFSHDYEVQLEITGKVDSTVHFEHSKSDSNISQLCMGTVYVPNMEEKELERLKKQMEQVTSEYTDWISEKLPGEDNQ